jgi:arylsulfatase A-like enzyme
MGVTMSNDGNYRPNVLILILDAVRARQMSGYGYAVRTTPHLDAFASDNILFQHAFSTANWSIPTHASMLSGLYLSQHRLENVNGDREFNENIVTLPHALRDVGYRTVAFSENQLFSPRHHFDCFDEFYEIERVMQAKSLTRFIRRSSKRPKGFWRLAGRYLRKMMAPRLSLNAMYNWIAGGDETRPFFLMVNLSSAHYGWAPPPDLALRFLGPQLRHLSSEDFTTLKPFEYNSGKRRPTEVQRQVWRKLYDAAISHLDREVGRFLRRLRCWRGWDRTIIVVTADHGEMLGEYRGIVGHTLSLHDNLIHVPLIVRHPDYSSGSEVKEVVQLLDLYPSILEWAGVEMGGIPSAQLQRPSLSCAVASELPSGVAFAEEDFTDSYDVIRGLLGVNPDMDPQKYPRRQVAVRSITHKYLWCNDRKGEFYNLVVDQGEEHNLIDTDAPKEKAFLVDLQQALEKWNSDLEIFPPRKANTEVDPEVIERLRALGYVA